MSEIPFYWLDVFTSKPFCGGPTVVCIVEEDLEDSIYSNIAKETELMEIAFVRKMGESEYNLRWFYSDGSEAPFAGYATLGVAHTLVQEYGVKSPITFHTLTGEWKADIDDDGKVTVFIPFLFDFKKINDERILEALGINEYVEILYTNKPMTAYCIVLENADQVREIVPDHCRIRKVLDELDSIGVSVTAKGDGSVDFVYRLFVRGREDYACGSGQAGLAPYWKEKLGKDVVYSRQPHHRGSDLSAEPLDNGVKITSSARILVKGTLYV